MIMSVVSIMQIEERKITESMQTCLFQIGPVLIFTNQTNMFMNKALTVKGKVTFAGFFLMTLIARIAAVVGSITLPAFSRYELN